MNGNNPNAPRKGAKKTRASRYEFMKPVSGPPKKFDLSRIDPATVSDAITAVLEAGDLISFTLTSDGGALCISVTCQGERYKTYCTSTSDAEDTLTAMTIRSSE